MLNSYGKGSPHQGRNLNDTRNTSILKPEITSTPLNSPNKGRTASSLVTPNRKFLGPRRYALSTNGTLSPLKVIKDPPGPLLTSANFNVNVSTYIDTKSPGYAGRLVQYNEENSRNQQHTHQEKYGSPGLFPIVHLFKKNIPVISPKPKKPTVRIGTPELKNQYSQEHNRLLLEGIVRSNSVIKHHNLSNEVSTRSVLDALKEISRKRIHASEDYEATDESNKKLRRDCLNGDGDSSKRNRVDSPTLDTSISPPARQATKKLCTIDAILASKTSSMYANYDTGTKRKTIDDTKTKISPVNKRKFNNAETQTFCTPTSTNEEEIVHTKQPELDKKQEATSTEDIPDQEEIAHPPKQILKVFDDKPLEVIRKNRLGALLSALTGHEIPPIPMEDRRKALDQEWPPQSSEKKLTSILSPQNKLSKSVEKHVTFKLPETSNSQTNDSVSLQEKNSDSAEKNSTDEIKIDPPSQMSTPENSSTTNDSIESTSQTKFNDKNNSINNIQKLSDKNSVEQSTGGLKFESPPVSKWSSPIGGFKFDLTKPNTFSPKNSIDNTSATLSSKNSEPKSENSNINFARASVEATTSSTLFSKFEAASSKPTKSSPLSLKASLETNSLLKSSPISSTTTNALGLPLSLPNSSITQPLGQITSIAPFTFNTSLSTANSTSANLLEKKSDVSKTNNISSTFASPFIPGSSGVTTSLTFGTTVSYSAANSSKVSVGIAKTTSSPAYSSTANNNSTFVGTSIMSSTSNTIIPASTSGKSEIFGAISSASSTSSGLSTSAVGNSGSTNLFSAMSTVPPSSSVTFSVPSFGTAISSSGFNVSSGNSLPSYNNMPPTSSFPSSSAANVLGVSPSGTKATTSFVSAPTLTSSFGSVTNSNPIFGSTTTPSFENNTSLNNSFSTGSKPFTFGNQSSPAKSSSMFTLGTNTNTSTAQNIQFGSAATGFGATAGNMPPSTISSNFGQSTAVSPFGTPSVSTFSTPPTTATFGTTSVLNFGVPSKTSLPGFGVSNSTTSIFGTTNTFGAVTTTVSGFGTSNTSSFGLPSTTTPSFGTPSTTTPAFGTPSTTTPAFGVPSSTVPTFGTPSTTPAFGTNTPSFGNSTTSSVFGTSNTLTFGNSTTSSGFGTSNTSSFGATGAFRAPSFGTSSAPFGNTQTTSANTFNSSTALPFGSSAGTNSFGTFGTTSSPFNPVTTASSFSTNNNNNNFGGNSASTFGSSNVPTNAFGSSASNNAFGSSNATGAPFGPAPMVNSFGNSNPQGSNTFGSGFGAPASKPEQSSIFPPLSNNMFGNNSTFGSSQSNGNVNTASTSGVFTFGSPNAQPSSSTGVFAFGTPEPPKSFNFSAPGTSSGTPAMPNTGFSAAPSFGTSGSSMPNMFSIGSGTSSTQSRSRPVARAKRRT